MLYHAIFESHLIYSLPVWGSMIDKTKQKSKLIKKQNKLLDAIQIKNVLSIDQLIEFM